MFLRSPLLESIPWLEHGFGTKHGPLSQDGMASLKQIHSSLSLVADRREGCVGEGDALLTREPGVIVSVRTADCFPILLADTVDSRGGGGACRVARDGRSGACARRFGACGRSSAPKPPTLSAAIGPGIGACCYEVGEDVARRFGLERAAESIWPQENAATVDSPPGVLRDRISVAGACTFCDRGEVLFLASGPRTTPAE